MLVSGHVDTVVDGMYQYSAMPRTPPTRTISPRKPHSERPTSREFVKQNDDFVDPMDAGTSEGSDSADPIPRRHTQHSHTAPFTSHAAVSSKTSIGSPTLVTTSKSSLMKTAKDQSHITFSPSTKSLVGYSLPDSLTHCSLILEHGRVNTCE